jgi:hypothetical protein
MLPDIGILLIAYLVRGRYTDPTVGAITDHRVANTFNKIGRGPFSWALRPSRTRAGKPSTQFRVLASMEQVTQPELHLRWR